MDKLPPLPSITRLSNSVVRVLGQNPGKFTLQGTNTYLIGPTNPYILLDTGAGQTAFPPLLQSMLKATHAHLPDISDIVITHKHHDHVCGLPSVIGVLRELWVAQNGGVYHDLHDGQSIFIPSPDAPQQVLKVIHTPGHTADSISLLYPTDRALFTGDTVLGKGTAVFEDLGSYVASLRTMLHAARNEDFGQGKPEGKAEATYTLLYPGHGPVVEEGTTTIRMYIEHRLEREEQIIEAIGVPPPGSSDDIWTTWGVVEKLYARYPQSLWEPAAHGIQLHLKKLEKEGRVIYDGGEGKEARWKLITG
ncbi:hypothetical protein HETIRDRAFT_379268 [Heterobasidion irregulare TC 32-1]|uniref:Metallo-beta-lactamase domain-containing protein n=1 Tax=Heterobasidion irregulare (strain TC 32-1) TaxID=747525 RepID=W4KHM6_HETIT|nr:uncharacterized protein HETIRDRAFT_379268 [Heterobasidion irregulare TC 32-1]ETW85353.1 hypothetical protein HETIRDRAFT_379268 [Heterobasidion irregulare TC 32-1]